jgi:hypothetical protein
MPWSPRDVMSLRQEFVLLARQPDANVRELCRRFAISPATAASCSSVMRSRARAVWPISHVGRKPRPGARQQPWSRPSWQCARPILPGPSQGLGTAAGGHAVKRPENGIKSPWLIPTFK